jgi:hypothetical protein
VPVVSSVFPVNSVSPLERSPASTESEVVPRILDQLKDYVQDSELDGSIQDPLGENVCVWCGGSGRSGMICPGCGRVDFRDDQDIDDDAMIAESSDV